MITMAIWYDVLLQVKCIITEPYNGSWCTCRYGVRAWFCRPMLEGDHIAVNVDEVFMVTRWHRYVCISHVMYHIITVAIVTGFMEIW